jgi:RNA polymerase sigma-70 factor (ECF subfamily)
MAAVHGASVWPESGGTAVDLPTYGESSKERESTRETLFESLVTEHWRLIYRIAFRLTGNQTEADDLTQEAVLEAFRAFDRFQPGTRFDRWIARIMTHTFIDGARRRRRHTVVSLDEPDAPNLADTAPGPEETASQRELQDRIQQALTALAPEFRTAVILVDLEGHSYEDASRIMDTPIGTVRSRLHRARQALRRSLGPVLDAAETASR